jgi:enamine deaminase RidA (YjgF/YER057c/UK114 family)
MPDRPDPDVRDIVMRTHNPPTVWTVPEGFRPIYSHAVEVRPAARYLFVSGQLGIAPDGAMQSDFIAQLEHAMGNVESLLASAGMDLGALVKLTFLLTRATDVAALGEIRRRRWSSDAPPAITVMVVAALARADALVEIEAIAAARERTRSALRKVSPR